jgi:hypothetical protein
MSERRPDRRCEPKAKQSSLSAVSGLPRRFAPRNDDVGDAQKTCRQSRRRIKRRRIEET